MHLTKKGDYAVRALLDLARHHPDLRTARQITASMDMPRNFVSQILGVLVRHEILRSSLGPIGGYVLARPPAEISLLDVIEIIEGPLNVDTCILGGGSCDWTHVCPLHETWSEAKSDLARQIGRTTFENLAEIDDAIRAGTYELPGHTPPHPTMPPRRGIDS